MNNDRFWDGFWVFAGTDRSARFDRAVPVDRAFADRILRTASGQPYAWSSNRSELQVIGSYTRACRRIIDPQEADLRWQVGGVEEGCGGGESRVCWRGWCDVTGDTIRNAGFNWSNWFRFSVIGRGVLSSVANN